MKNLNYLINPTMFDHHTSFPIELLIVNGLYPTGLV